jgi:hypothetical protein
VDSASCGMRWEICLFLLVELMMAVVGFQLWVLGWRLSVIGYRLWVFGCGLCFVWDAVGNLFIYTR